MSSEMEKELKADGSLDEPNRILAEFNHFRSIFPEVVWIEILKWVKLLFPEDLENWSNSSPFFRRLLQDQRVIFLFPKVFDVMAPKYEQRYPADQQRDNCYREDPVENPDPNQEFNADRGIHQLTGVMKCRQVCRSWNKTIQNYYEDPQKPAGRSHFEMRYDRNRIQKSEDRYIHILRWDRIDFWKNRLFDCSRSIGSPGEFADHFGNTHHLKKNPLMGRSVKIRDCIYIDGDPEELETFLNGVDLVLGNYGKEVWYFDIVLDWTNPEEFSETYSMLKRWIAMMPNLKTLQIIQYVMDYDQIEWDLQPLDEYLPALEREIRENPLPKLEHLEFLSVKNLVAPIFNELIRQNDHITGLEMERDLLDVNGIAYMYDLDFVLNSIPNLKQLGIHLFIEEELIKLEEKMGEVGLEKFQLTDVKGSPFHWGRLLGLVKGSSGTLTDLVVELPFVETEGGDLMEMTKSQDMAVGLEKLERLALCVGRPLFLDWLLPAKDTLKQLELVIPRQLHLANDFDKMVGEQRIKVFGFEDKMEMSNIWEFFGNLEMVKICKGCLRDGYTHKWMEFSRPE